MIKTFNITYEKGMNASVIIEEKIKSSNVKKAEKILRSRHKNEFITIRNIDEM